MEKHEVKMTELLTVIADNIKSLRKDKRYSQERLAELAGLHPTYVSHLETGKANPTLAILLAVSEILGVSIERLIMPECAFATDEALVGLQKKLEKLDENKKAAVSSIIADLNRLLT